jgi:hypothetical protein
MQTIQGVEQSSFTGTVWSNQTQDFTRLQLERNPIQGYNSTELFGDFFNLQNGGFFHNNPSGKYTKN